eukprot:gene10620-22173_t
MCSKQSNRLPQGSIGVLLGRNLNDQGCTSCKKTYGFSGKFIFRVNTEDSIDIEDESLSNRSVQKVPSLSQEYMDRIWSISDSSNSSLSILSRQIKSIVSSFRVNHKLKKKPLARRIKQKEYSFHGLGRVFPLEVYDECNTPPIDNTNLVTKQMLSIHQQNSNVTSSPFLFKYDITSIPIQSIPIHNENINLYDLSDMNHLIDGSYSNIFEAVNDELSTIIIKIMKKNMNRRESARREFDLEHQILMRISHPHIVGYYGGGVGDGKRPFLCLEILTGGSLASIMNNPNRNTSRSPFSTKRVLEIAFQFADALNYLHTGYHPDVTLIHRDLKPDNIGFTDKGMLKLMDFGLCACVRRRQDMDQTYAMTGNTGSIRYMAPEVLQSLPYNEMVDIYSFGIILWEMATGQTPYQGITIKEFFIRVVINNERPAINSTHSRCISEILATIIQKCWDKNPIKRPKASFIVTHILELLELEQAKKSTSCCTLS